MSFDLLEQRIKSTPRCKVGMGASLRAVGAAEAALGVVFPSSLREYLARFGWLEIGSKEFYGLGDDVPRFLELVRLTTSERTEAGVPLPPSLIPLLNDGAGNLYCMVTTPGPFDEGAILFWDHEKGAGQVPETIAPDLEYWLDSILNELPAG